MIRLRASSVVFVAALAVAFLPAGAQRVADAPTSLPPLKVVDANYVNRQANACVDFFDFANGAWLVKDTIPAAYSSSGVGRDMNDRNQLVVRSVLDDAVARRASLPATSSTRKLGTFYATCMDSAATERAGFDSLKPALADIDAVSSPQSLLAEVAKLQVAG